MGCGADATPAPSCGASRAAKPHGVRTTSCAIERRLRRAQGERGIAWREIRGGGGAARGTGGSATRSAWRLSAGRLRWPSGQRRPIGVVSARLAPGTRGPSSRVHPCVSLLRRTRSRVAPLLGRGRLHRRIAPWRGRVYGSRRATSGELLGGVRRVHGGPAALSQALSGEAQPRGGWRSCQICAPHSGCLPREHPD